MLTARLQSALVISLITAIAFFSPGWLGASVFIIAVMLTFWELVGEYSDIIERIGMRTGKTALRGFIILLIVSLFLPLVLSRGNAAAAGLSGWEIGILTIFMIYSFLSAFRHRDMHKGFHVFAGNVTGIALMYGLLGFIPKLYFLTGIDGNGRWLLLFVLIVTKAGDVGAYTSGTLTSRRPGGNRKICPQLSPKKSWEGLAGGVISCIVAGLIFYAVGRNHFYLQGLPVLSLTPVVLLSAGFAVIGLIGDLAASFLKRAADIADSGRLPGLGGVIDITDSLLFTVPLFYAYLQL